MPTKSAEILLALHHWAFCVKTCGAVSSSNNGKYAGIAEMAEKYTSLCRYPTAPFPSPSPTVLKSPSLHMPRHPSSLLGTWEPSTLQRRFGPNFSSSKPHPSSSTAFNTPGTLHFLPLSTTTRGILMLELA